jgi:selenide,water dikinase
MRVTLVTDRLETPYSGMLPGLIAGHYSHAETHIDLRPLAAHAGAELVHWPATALDPGSGRVTLSDGRVLDCDLLSLDIGSTAKADVPGAAEYAMPVRPVSRFLEALEDWSARAERGPLTIAVAGGGAGGVELLLSVQNRFARTGQDHRYRLLTAGDLSRVFNRRAGKAFRRILAERQVEVREHTEIVRVHPDRVETAEGSEIGFDILVWTTGPGPHAWLADTGLALDRGFVAVDRCLQSTSHPGVFAVGDTATVVSDPRPKAGVFAVRQGPPLDENLRRAARGEALRETRAQRRYLALISTGDRYAVAVRGALKLEGRAMWWLKDRIDRGWMARYQLDPMTGDDA